MDDSNNNVHTPCTSPGFATCLWSLWYRGEVDMDMSRLKGFVSAVAVAAADFIHESRHSFRVKTLSESAVIGLQPSLDVRAVNWDDVRSQFVVRTFEQSINFAS